jgi:hypothetical protein
VGNTFTLSIEIPEEVADARALAGSLALATGRVLLGEQPFGREVTGEGAAGETLPPSAIAVAEGPYSGDDAESDLRRLIREIAPSTRVAVRTIAEASLASGSIHAVQLREKLSIGSPSALAGVLTSLGFAERRTGLPKPYAQHWGQHNGTEGNEYVMRPDVAQIIVRLLDESGRIV